MTVSNDELNGILRQMRNDRDIYNQNYFDLGRAIDRADTAIGPEGVSVQDLLILTRERVEKNLKDIQLAINTLDAAVLRNHGERFRWRPLMDITDFC